MFLDTCESVFDTRDLYEILGISQKASQSEVKKGYYKVSLKVHPDRVKPENRTEATAKFQALGKVYNILSDKDTRAVYDESGEVPDEDENIDTDKDWVDYWRLMFPKVTEEAIDKYKVTYIGSEEEMEDLKNAYIKWEGSMEHILESVPYSSEDDIDRFYDTLKSLVDSKDLPKMKNFKKLTKREKAMLKSGARDEAKEAAEERKRLKLDDDGGESSLAALIASRQSGRRRQMDSFLADMEAKYSKPSRKKKS